MGKVKEFGWTFAGPKEGIDLTNKAEVEKHIYVRNQRTDNLKGAVKIDWSVAPTEKAYGSGHTHPYSKKEGGHTGVAHSHDDLSLMRGKEYKDFVKIIEAGDARYALVISDAFQATKYFDANSSQAIKAKFEAVLSQYASLPAPERVEKALLSVVGDEGTSGIGVYRTTDKQKSEWKQLNTPTPPSESEDSGSPAAPQTPKDSPANKDKE